MTDMAQGPIFQSELHLSNKHYSHERSAYTFLALIGDFGGFNGAILLFLNALMTLYSELLFKADLIKEVPVRKPAHTDRRMT